MTVKWTRMVAMDMETTALTQKIFTNAGKCTGLASRLNMKVKTRKVKPYPSKKRHMKNKQTGRLKVK